MSVLTQLGTSWSTAGTVVIATCGIYAMVIAATRLLGLRTFSKMSSFDFAATIATGSLMASVAMATTPLATGAVAVAVIFGLQGVLSFGRQRGLSRVVDNTPLLLMDGPRMLLDNMRAARITRDDLIAKLREANVLSLSQVHCVVFETTGDVSVLHNGADRDELDPELLSGVRRGDPVRSAEGQL